MYRQYSNFRLFLLLTVFLGLIAAMSACSPIVAPQPKPAVPMVETAVSVKVGVLPLLSYAVYYIAEEEGYFAEQGLDVELVQFRSSNEFIPLLLDGELDVAQPTLTAGFFNAISRGGNLKMVLPGTTFVEQECNFTAFFVRRADFDSGTYAEPTQWKGSRVALSPAGAQSTAGYMTERFLQQGGLRLSDIELPVVDLAAQPEALRSGQVDVVLAAEPAVTRMKKDSELAMLMSGDGLIAGLTSSSVVFSERMLEEPQVAARFLAAYLKGVRQYQQGATPRNLELLSGFSGLDAALVGELCLAVINADGNFNLDAIAEYQNWLIDQDLLDGEVAPEDFVETRFFDEAKLILGEQEE